jgi:hypothetical protein
MFQGTWGLILDQDGRKKRKGDGPVTLALRCAYRRAGGFDGKLISFVIFGG